MKTTWIAALAAALFSACAPHAGAVSFLPLPEDTGNAGVSGAGLAPAGEPTLPPSRIRVGAFATFWKLPEVSISRVTGYSGDAVRFATTTQPVIEVDGRVGPRLRVGGWYNPLDTHLWLKGPTADLLKAQAQPVNTELARTSLNMWNLHATYELPKDFAVSFGVSSYEGSVDLLMQNPRGPGDMQVKADLGTTEYSLWGYHSMRIFPELKHLTYFTGGLGVCHRVADVPGNRTSLEASAGVAYFPWDTISLNANVWATDVTNHNAFTARLSTGVTGHF